MIVADQFAVDALLAVERDVNFACSAGDVIVGKNPARHRR